MFEANAQRLLNELRPDALVLDVGGWACPFNRAQWILDAEPFETRGYYRTFGGPPSQGGEREWFSKDTWVQRDICAREAWPFADKQFDFVICSHTLEDVRDPVWVCSELNRVGKAGYIEVPARVEEQTPGVHGNWVGWSHHHWLVDIDEGHVQFVLKPHLLHGRPEFWVDRDWTHSLAPEDRISRLSWESSFEYSERIFIDSDELHSYLRGEVDRNVGVTAESRGARHLFRRVRRALRRPG